MPERVSGTGTSDVFAHTSAVGTRFKDRKQQLRHLETMAFNSIRIEIVSN
jgi:hypothetical protein